MKFKKYCNNSIENNLCKDYLYELKEKKFDFTDKFTSQGIQIAISDALGGEYIVDIEMLKNSKDVKLKDLITETISRKYKIISVD